MLHPYTVFFWAAIAPLLLLIYYYYRIPSAPSLIRLLFFFTLGAISGFFAFGLEFAFEIVANHFVNWQKLQRSIIGAILRQLVEIGPIEEGCKLVAVIAPTFYLQRQYQFRPTSVFLLGTAVCLGFTTQENWIYLFNDTASILERTISTPIHLMFSVPWVYALAISMKANIHSHRNARRIFGAWLNAVVCHALVNVLSMSGRYLAPLSWLSYGLFPFLVWMFWRLQQLSRRLQGKLPITLISGRTAREIFEQRALALLALLLTGNALFGLFALAKSLSFLKLSELLYSDTVQFILSRLLLNLSLGLLAWVIYHSLRRKAQRRYF